MSIIIIDEWRRATLYWKMAIYEKFLDAQMTPDGRLSGIKIRYRKNYNFAYDVMDKLAREQGTKRALLWCSDIAECKEFTFSDLKKLSSKAANFLTDNGIKQGDRVMLIMGRSYQFWYTMLALNKIGAIAIPCSNQLTTKDIKYRIEKANVKHVIITCDVEISKMVTKAVESFDRPISCFTVNGVCDGYIDYDAGLTHSKGTFARVPTLATDDMLMYFTSGTTGYPKCAVHNFTYPLAHIVTAKYWQNVTSDGLHLSVSDSGWAKCAWGKIYGQWLAETCIFVYDFHGKFNANDLCAVIKKHGVTTFCAPPTIYRFLAKEAATKTDDNDELDAEYLKKAFSTVKYAVTAGEPLNFEIYSLFKKETGIEIKEAFGQTETTCLIGFFTGDKVVEGSMGRANPQYRVITATENGAESPAGEVGEIAVDISFSRIGIIDRYLDDEKATAASFRNGLYYTGDLATRDADGNFFYESRTDDIIKASGYRIGPFEVESVLIEHPAVRECAVIGVEDDVRGVVIKACIVLTSATEPSAALKKELQQFVKANTAPYKYPRAIEFFEELPKTTSGKIKRRDLREMHNKK
jgi:acetyl-CoA synthetase